MKNLKNGLLRIDQPYIYLKGITNIVLAGDVGCTTLTEKSKNIFRKILRAEADFFIILGDLVYNGTPAEFEEFIKFSEENTKRPIFAICGNHDLPSYPQFLGRSNYAIVLDNHVIVAVNNSAELSKEDLSILENILRKHAAKKAIVLFHIPPPTDMAPDLSMWEHKWISIKNVLDKHKRNIEAIFSGHVHGFQEYYLEGYHVFITGGGGAVLQHYDKDTLKSHHAVRIKFENGVKFEVIPV